MNKRQTERKERLLPGGKPRWIRCYDNGGKTIDRYTVVFTNLRRYTPYLAMSGSPFWPQGFCQHGESQHRPVDYPTYGHLGKKIRYDDLPKECQDVVMEDYLALWGLEENHG